MAKKQGSSRVDAAIDQLGNFMKELGLGGGVSKVNEEVNINVTTTGVERSKKEISDLRKEIKDTDKEVVLNVKATEDKSVKKTKQNIQELSINGKNVNVIDDKKVAAQCQKAEERIHKMYEKVRKESLQIDDKRGHGTVRQFIHDYGTLLAADVRTMNKEISAINQYIKDRLDSMPLDYLKNYEGLIDVKSSKGKRGMPPTTSVNLNMDAVREVGEPIKKRLQHNKLLYALESRGLITEAQKAGFKIGEAFASGISNGNKNSKKNDITSEVEKFKKATSALSKITRIRYGDEITVATKNISRGLSDAEQEFRGLQNLIDKPVVSGLDKELNELEDWAKHNLLDEEVDRMTKDISMSFDRIVSGASSVAQEMDRLIHIAYTPAAEIDNDIMDVIDFTDEEKELKQFREALLEAAGDGDTYTKLASAFSDSFKRIGSGASDAATEIEKVQEALAQKAATTAQDKVQEELKETQEEAHKAAKDIENVIYHAGVISKHNKAETNGQFYGSNRGTGYYGTGHYFTDHKAKKELTGGSGYKDKPFTSVDISQYDNLFKANTDSLAYQLHEFLKGITRYTQGSDRYDIDYLFNEFKQVFGEDVMTRERFEDKLKELTKYMQGSHLGDMRDSVSTKFMKDLGYGGVDTRGTKYTGTDYGIVIYDLKEESILQANITDELQKQGDMLDKISYKKGEVWDKDTDEKLLGKLKENEVYDIMDQTFDCSKLEAYESELEELGREYKNVSDSIDYYLARLNDEELIKKDIAKFNKELEAFGLEAFGIDDDMSIDDEVAERKEQYANNYVEALQRQYELEKKIEKQEGLLNNEYDKYLEAKKSAEAVVDARHKEVEAAQEVSVVSKETFDKDQQGAKESADAHEKFRDGLEKDAEAFHEEEKAAKDAEEALRRLLGTQHTFLVTEEGIKDINRSYTSQDKVGMRDRQTYVPFEDSEGNQTDAVMHSVSINYQQIAKKASDAMLRAAKAQHDWDLEAAKMEPNLNILRDLTEIIDRAGKEYDEARDAAIDFVKQTEFFHNDSRFDSKYVGAMFNRDVTEMSADRLAKADMSFERALDQNAKRTQNQIDATNDRLEKYREKSMRIQLKYDQNVAPGVNKPVTDANDLVELWKKDAEIQDIIRDIQKKVDDGKIPTRDEMREVEKLIEEYDALVKVKKDVNNPTKRELGGQDLAGAVQREIANLDEAIDKSEQYGAATQEITDKLKGLKDALEKSGDVKTYYDTIDERKIQVAKLKSEEIKQKRSVADEKDLNKDVAFDAQIDSAKVRLDAYRKKLKDAGVTADETKVSVKELYDILAGSTKTNGGIQAFNAKFKLFKEMNSLNTSDVKDSAQTNSIAKQLDIYKEMLSNKKELARLDEDDPKNEQMIAVLKKQNQELGQQYLSLQKIIASENEETILVALAAQKQEMYAKTLREIERIQAKAGTGLPENFDLAKEIKIGQIEQYRDVLVKVGAGSHEVLDELDKLLGKFKEAPDMNGIRKADLEFKKFKQDISENIDIAQKLNVAYKRADQTAQNTQAYVNAVSGLRGEYEGIDFWIDKVEDLNKEAQEAKATLANIMNIPETERADTIDDVLDRLVRIKAESVEAKSYINGIRSALDTKYIGTEKIQNLITNTETYLRKNSGAAKEYREELRAAVSQLQHMLIAGKALPEEFAEIHNQINKIRAAMESTGNIGISMWDRMKRSLKSQIAQQAAMYLSLQDFIRYFRTAFETIRELDYALVDLRKTTTMSAKDLNQFYLDANESAKQYGVTTKEIIDQAAQWSRLGFSSKEEATKMAEMSSKFTLISPGMDVQQSMDGLVSTMKAYGIEVSDVESEIMDKVNIIGRFCRNVW